MKHKVYYDKKRDFTVVDVSSVKPMKEIEKEFGKSKWQTVFIDPFCEVFVVIDGKLSKKPLEK